MIKKIKISVCFLLLFSAVHSQEITTILKSEYEASMISSGKNYPTVSLGKNNLDDRISLNKQVANFEANIIRQVMDENDWNQSKAARKLNISEQTIRYKINKYHIIKPE